MVNDKWLIAKGLEQGISGGPAGVQILMGQKLYLDQLWSIPVQYDGQKVGRKIHAKIPENSDHAIYLTCVPFTRNTILEMLMRKSPSLQKRVLLL